MNPPPRGVGARREGPVGSRRRGLPARHLTALRLSRRALQPRQRAAGQERRPGSSHAFPPRAGDGPRIGRRPQQSGPGPDGGQAVARSDRPVPCGAEGRPPVRDRSPQPRRRARRRGPLYRGDHPPAARWSSGRTTRPCATTWEASCSRADVPPRPSRTFGSRSRATPARRRRTTTSASRSDQAIDHFRQALAINPEFADAKRNLEIAGRAQFDDAFTKL